MDVFTPSLDWGNELVTSLVWIAKAWTISAAVTLLVLVLIERFTEWGRQYWHITKRYFVGPGSARVWCGWQSSCCSSSRACAWTSCSATRATICTPSLQTAFQGVGAGDDAAAESGRHGFGCRSVVFSILATIHVVRLMLDLFLTQRFMLDWRPG